ncbi:MAG TPA: sugar-transfer associated ATP-grasp domain-containing protein [Patescibacteria group bacterium]|nr:sugar-transfer associated ATP-grasp domain-containing protein [Patescibacteria group bacterium]
MVKASHILGLNARNQLYEPLNSAAAVKFGTSKLRAKQFLAKHGIIVAQLYAQIDDEDRLRKFSWSSIDGPFVIKPANGSAGKGVLVIKKKKKHESIWVDLEDRELRAQDLNLHVSNILQGEYSTWGSKPQALIEERVPLHPDLADIVELGTPDIRVIVFNNIPVMAELRLPTKASGGRANLHQGAIGLGVDFGTGETTSGVTGGNKIFTKFPGTDRSTAGIPVPYWTDILKIAVRAANATGFAYVGVDLFMHPEKGPMVAELNRAPGLAIQLANHAGLKRRLQRVEEMEARNVSHAVRIAQSLFAQNIPPSQESDVDLTIIAPKEKVLVYDANDKDHESNAIMNTGRFRSAISHSYAQHLGLFTPSEFLWKQEIEGEGKVPVIEVTVKIRHKVIKTSMIVTKKLDHSRSPIEIGRKDLGGFLVGEPL